MTVSIEVFRIIMIVFIFIEIALDTTWLKQFSVIIMSILVLCSYLIQYQIG